MATNTDLDGRPEKELPAQAASVGCTGERQLQESLEHLDSFGRRLVSILAAQTSSYSRVGGCRPTCSLADLARGGSGVEDAHARCSGLHRTSYAQRASRMDEGCRGGENEAQEAAERYRVDAGHRSTTSPQLLGRASACRRGEGPSHASSRPRDRRRQAASCMEQLERAR